MRTNRLFVIFGWAVIALAAPPLYADDPPCAPPQTWTVRYWVHETPADPNSPVTLKYELALTAVAGDCTATGWAVASIEIRQVDPLGGPDRVWAQNDPNVPTADGLWWVSHADVANPQSNEFVLPPNLVGIATAADPNDADLYYNIAGVAETPPDPPSYQVAAVLSQELVLVGDQEAISADSGVPVDVDPPVHN